MTPEQTKSAYQRVCEQECELCRLKMPFLPTSLRPVDKPTHEVSSPGSNRDDYEPCTAPSKDAFMERQAAQIAAMQAALVQGGHAANCESLGDNKAPHAGVWMPHRELMPERCNCYLSALSDDVERGKELLGTLQASRYNADVATQAMEEMKRQAVEIEELRANIRFVAGGAKTLVRCGCLGCLTDDCDHWGNDCSVKDMTLCRIGRTLDAAMKEKP